jgi:alpha-1,3-rhamnosyl/mannosyltransferase
LVYPSLCEGFGLPMLEAAAVGARVIASTSAVPSSLEPYVETFEPGDIRALLALMAGTAADGRSEQARRFARSQTWDRCAYATAEVYREIVRAKGSR